MDSARSFAAWDPFTDASDALQGRTTEYEYEHADASASASSVALGVASTLGHGDDWDPFTDPEMLDLAGELALESEDVEALETWLQQARSARLPREKILPKDEKLRELKWKREDQRKRRVVKEKLAVAMRGNDWAKLRETIGDAARAGVAHPKQLHEASLQLQSLRSAEADYFRRKDVADTARRDEANQAMAERTAEKLWKKVLVPSLEVEVTDEERGALEWVLCKPRPEFMQVRLVFPAGDEEHVEVHSSDTATALLTALLPAKSKHRLPRNLALFTSSGDLLRLERSLQAQGVRTGSTVRVDDAERGARETTVPVTSAGAELQLLPAAGGHSRSPGSTWTATAFQDFAAPLRSKSDLLQGQGSVLQRYAFLAQSAQRQRLPLALCDEAVAAEVVPEDDGGAAGDSILEWMDDYIRQVVHGLPPRGAACSASTPGPEALFEEWEQAVEAEEEARLEEEDFMRFEVDECWVHVYWPLSYTKPALSDFREELRKHAETVVIGWNATGDRQVLELSHEVCKLARAGRLVVTGDEPPRAGSASEKTPTSSSSTSTSTSALTYFLRLSSHAESREAGKAVHACLRNAGVGNSRALVVVSRTFQSKRIALALDRYRGPLALSTTGAGAAKAKAKAKGQGGPPTLAIIPYCVDPQEAVLQDCMDRKQDILVEAQLLVEMDARLLSSEAMEALSLLLEAVSTPSRPGWEGGVYCAPPSGGRGAGGEDVLELEETAEESFDEEDWEQEDIDG